jgi:hypothetical protein
LRGVGTAPVVSLALNHRLKAENPLGSRGFWVQETSGFKRLLGSRDFWGFWHRILEGDSHVLMVLGDYAQTLTQRMSVR